MADNLTTKLALPVNDRDANGYALVSFLDEEDSLAIVPVIWLKSSSLCWWPPYSSSKINRAVKEKEKANESTWTLHRIIVKYSSGSYDQVRSKLTKAQYTSDLTSGEEFRKRRRPRSSSSEDEFDVTPKRSNVKSVLPVSQIHYNSKANNESILQEAHCSNVDIASYPIVIEPLPQDGVKEEEFRHFKNQVFTSLEAIKNQNQHIISLLSKLCENQVVDCIVEGEQITLPVNTYEDLFKLDKSVEEDNSNKKKLIRQLSCHGGNNTGDTTRRILNALIGHDLAIELVWVVKGPNAAHKKSIQNARNILDAIFCSVQKNPLTRGAFRKDVDDVVKVWLRTAKDRNGGRSKRSLKDVDSVTVISEPPPSPQDN